MEERWQGAITGKGSVLLQSHSQEDKICLKYQYRGLPSPPRLDRGTFTTTLELRGPQSITLLQRPDKKWQPKKLSTAGFKNFQTLPKSVTFVEKVAILPKTVGPHSMLNLKFDKPTIIV